jgi:hypothetical protein
MPQHDIEDDDLLLDRHLIADFSTELLGPGAKVSFSKINKLAMKGEGPPVDFYLGPKGLTKKGNARTWLRSLLRSPDTAGTP